MSFEDVSKISVMTKTIGTCSMVFHSDFGKSSFGGAVDIG